MVLKTGKVGILRDTFKSDEDRVDAGKPRQRV